MSSEAHPELCFTNFSSIKFIVKTKHLSRELYTLFLLIDTDLASDSDGPAGLLSNKSDQETL